MGNKLKALKCFVSLALFLSLSLMGCAAVYRPPQREEGSRGSAKSVTLTILEGQSTSDAGIQDMLTDMLKSKFPNVNFEWESVDWGEQFSSQMQAEFASGEFPDLIIGKAQDVATYALPGYLAPLKNELASYMTPEGLHAGTVNGKLYGAPYNAVYQGVLYNKNLFWRYNVRPPKTLKELNNITERFKQVGITPFAAHFKENWYIGNITMQFVTNEIFLKNPLWGSEMRQGLHSFSASKEYAACILHVRDILNNTWDDAFGIEQAQSDRRFANGEAAMYLTGSWSIQSIHAIRPDLALGIFPYPNQDGNAKLIFEPNLTFMKSSKTKNSDLVDQILLTVFKDNDLAESIFDFTQTSSMLKSVPSRYPALIHSDIEAYTKAEQTTDVTVGNTQLIWSFQDSYSRKISEWLGGKRELSSVLQYMDSNKEDSFKKE